MKKILFIVIPEKGHVNPSIGVAQYLQRLGHTISFYAAHDISQQLSKAGLNHFIGSRVSNNSHQGAEFTAKVKDKQWLRSWIKQLLITDAQSGIAPMQEMISNYDLIVCDPMIYPAVIACERIGIPWVALSNSLNPVLNDKITSDLLDTVSSLEEERSLLFRDIEVSFRGCDALSSLLTIAFTTYEFTGYRFDDVALVGPASVIDVRGDEVDFPWSEIRDDLPLIYASFGSQVYHQPEIFRRLFNLVEGRPVQLVAAVHDLVFESVPSNVIVSGYTPQLDLLDRASVMITHGGANSVMEALSADVPVLIHPICNDQFHQAWFLENAQCGKEINIETMNDLELWGGVEWALSADITHVSESYQVNGSLKAAELIDQL